VHINPCLKLTQTEALTEHPLKDTIGANKDIVLQKGKASLKRVNEKSTDSQSSGSRYSNVPADNRSSGKQLNKLSHFCCSLKSIFRKI